MDALVVDPTNAQESVEWRVRCMMDGTLRTIMEFSGKLNDIQGTGEIVFNESSRDIDLRIESDGHVDAFHLDGVTGIVTLRTNLHVGGTLSISQDVQVAGRVYNGNPAQDSYTGTTYTPDLSLGHRIYVYLTNSPTVTFPTNYLATEHLITFIQGAGGNFGITMATGYKMKGGVAPVLTAAAGSIDVLGISPHVLYPTTNVFAMLNEDFK